MAKLYALELVGSGYTFTFAVEGEVLPRYVAEYKENADDPVLIGLRETWDCGRCLLVSTHATTPARDLLQQLFAVAARLETRTASPISARLIWDPSGTPSTLRTLGGAGYEKFRIELMEVERQPQVRGSGDRRTSLAVHLRLSAVEKFAETVTGLVLFDQKVFLDGEAGNRVITYRTELTTKAGVDAREKAAEYAAIDITSLGGSNWSYLTNTEEGITYEAVDSDVPNSRVPNHVIAISRVREWGVDIGASAPGTAPTDVGLRIQRTEDARTVITRTTARAKGPGYAAWIASQAPVNFFAIEDDTEDEESQSATKTWLVLEDKARSHYWELTSITLAGGGKAQTWEAVGGFRPVRQTGALTHLVLTVVGRVVRHGLFLTNRDLLLPGPLPAPWVLQDHLCQEDDAEIEPGGEALDAGQSRWVRRFTAVWHADRPPAIAPGVHLRASRGVVSYKGLA